MALGGNITGSREKGDYFRAVIIDNVGTYFFYGHINNTEVDSTYSMNDYLNLFTKEKIYTMTGPGKPNPSGIMTNALNIKHN